MATTIVRHEHDLGAWTYATRAPDPRLAPLMYRPLLGFEQERAEFGSWLEAPRPALTLMVDLKGAIRSDHERLPASWFAGLDDTYSVVEFGGTYASIDLEFTPLGAHRILGWPLSELTGRVVALEDLFGARGSELAARLREPVGWDERFDLLRRAGRRSPPRPASATSRT